MSKPATSRLEKTFAVNVFGPTMLAKGLSPMMRTKGRTKVKVSTLEGPVDVQLPKKVRERLARSRGSQEFSYA